MDASVALTSVAWGTRVVLTCSYAEPRGLPRRPGADMYSLVVARTDGAVEQVATWQGLPGKTMHLTGANALTPRRSCPSRCGRPAASSSAG